MAMTTVVDFGRTAADYRTHRADVPKEPLAVPHRLWAMIGRNPD
ncbi:MAG: hypothetical protein QNJ94_11895 [Alphaproteobacteria bacterium]|nr:hypothetical protein [Alphaproteobacteria bacterium]